MATVAPIAVRNGRNTELALLGLALLLGIGAYALAGIGYTDSVPADIFIYGGALTATALIFHLVLRWKAPFADPVILPVATALTGLGLAMIYRLDMPAAEKAAERGKEFAPFEPKQLMWYLIGSALAIAIIFILKDHRTLRRYTYTAMVIGLVLLVLPVLPIIGTEINGARIWIRVGPMSFQPAEMAKIALAIFFAGYLVTNRDTLTLAGKKFLGLQLPRFRDLGPIIIVWAASLAILIMEKDLGTSLLFFGIFVAMLYLATERGSWVIIGLILFAAGAASVVSRIPHVALRMELWVNTFDPEVYDRTQQLGQGLFGLAFGGLLGTGLGKGRPDITPYAESDFIVAALGEELGLTGLLAILVLYLIFVERGLRTAIGLRDGFGKLLAAGMSFTIALQCFIVVGGITRLIPLTGLTMPFLAYGGSSLVANWMIAALLLRMSDAARRPAPPAPPVPSGDGLTPNEGEPIPLPADVESTQIVRLL